MVYNKQTIAFKNRSSVINIIRTKSPINKAEIAKITGLSIPTVMKITDELEEMKMICSIGRGESTGGKPPEMLEFVPDAFYVVGVDIGRSRVKVILMNMDAKIYARKDMISAGTEDAENFIDRIADLVEEVIEEADIPVKRLLGIGIGMPGILNLSVGKVVFSPNFMWHDVDLLSVFKRRFSYPVYWENANRSLALGEKWFGISRSAHQILTVNLGYGIGAAMLEDNRIERGSSGCSGELGHMILKKDGDLCSCGNHGCLESISSGYAIARNARKKAEENQADRILQEAGGKLEEIEARHVFQAAKSGDPVAREIIREAIEYLGIGIASCINMWDPDMVVIAGGITKSADYFWEELKEQIRDHQMKFSALNVEIRKGKLGEDATAIGSAVLPLRKFINSGANYRALWDL